VRSDVEPKATLLAHWRRWAPLVVLLGLCILISLFNNNFLTVGNLVRMLNSASIPIVLCMGATFIILMGSIDLSVEGIVALAAVSVSLLVANDITANNFGLFAVPIAVLIGGIM
jgi:ribose transport system permease protein